MSDEDGIVDILRLDGTPERPFGAGVAIARAILKMVVDTFVGVWI